MLLLRSERGERVAALEYIKASTNRIHHFLPECIAFNQSALRHFLSECIAPRTTRGCHRLFAWIPVKNFALIYL